MIKRMGPRTRTSHRTPAAGYGHDHLDCFPEVGEIDGQSETKTRMHFD